MFKNNPHHGDPMPKKTPPKKTVKKRPSRAPEHKPRTVKNAGAALTEGEMRVLTRTLAEQGLINVDLADVHTLALTRALSRANVRVVAAEANERDAKDDLIRSKDVQQLARDTSIADKHRYDGAVQAFTLVIAQLANPLPANPGPASECYANSLNGQSPRPR